MIHIADTKVARRYGDFFIRNIHKFDEVCIRELIWFVVLCCVIVVIVMQFVAFSDI